METQMIEVEELVEVISKYKNIFNSNSKFLSLMRDLFPEEGLSVTLLYNALCLGIVEEIKKTDEISNIMQHRYVNLLIDKYGISKENAHWTINTWTSVFGKNTLNHNLCNSTSDYEESMENYTTYPYDIVFNDNIDDIINNFLLEPDNIKLKYHFVSYLSILVTRPQNSKDAEMYILKLIEDAIDKINTIDGTFEDKLREYLLQFTKGYSLFLQGRVSDAFKCIYTVCVSVKKSIDSEEVNRIIVLDELYKACILNIYSIMKICDIEANIFYENSQEIVSKCLQDVNICDDVNINETIYYFYTMSSPANDFYNVKMEVGNNTIYTLPDLIIGHLKISRKNNSIEVNWDCHGNKLYYSIELTSEMIACVNKISKEYKMI